MTYPTKEALVFVSHSGRILDSDEAACLSDTCSTSDQNSRHSEGSFSVLHNPSQHGTEERTTSCYMVFMTLVGVFLQRSCCWDGIRRKQAVIKAKTTLNVIQIITIDLKEWSRTLNSKWLACSHLYSIYDQTQINSSSCSFWKRKIPNHSLIAVCLVLKMKEN